MAKIQKIFNISFVLNKKVLILFNTMNKMNKILSIFIPHWGIFARYAISVCNKTFCCAPPHLSRLAQQIVDLLADIVDASGDMGSKRKKNTDELLHHRRIAIHLHG